MKFKLLHRTSFVYDKAIYDSYNEVRLCPVSDDLQICHSFELRIDPPGARILRRLDFYTNQVHSFELVEPHSHLQVVSDSLVETIADKRDFAVATDPARLAGLSGEEWLYDFLNGSHHVPIIPMVIHEAREISHPMRDLQQTVERILAFVHGEFIYSSGATIIETKLVEVMEHRKGVCQDFAHVMIALCRAVGIPSRYVSGYFWVERPSGGSADDNTASHAWVECFLPGIGWTGYDPTHNRRVNETYIKVATGRDYSDARPLYGTFRGQTKAEMQVNVTVTRLD